MSTVTTPNLGTIITNDNVRRGIYGTYVVALVVTGGIQVAYAAISLGQPTWLVATLAVLAYLGIPVGGLALANATSKPSTVVVNAPAPVIGVDTGIPAQPVPGE